MQLFRKRKSEERLIGVRSDACDREPPEKILETGTPAPGFTLKSAAGSDISLNDYNGQPVILVFYPGDWTPVCGDQLSLYNEILDLFEEHNAQILGISVDSWWSHQAYTESRNLKFPLLSDFEPKGKIARLYGVYDPKAGNSARALFVIDRDGIIRWSYLSPKNINPGAHGILNALEALALSEE